MAQKAQLYKDVAKLTGLLYPFTVLFKRTASNSLDKKDTERELKKLIEKVEDAHAFNYFFCDYYKPYEESKRTVVQVSFYRNPDNYFIYDRTIDLLRDLGLNPSERESIDLETQQRRLTLYSEDIDHAYNYFLSSDMYEPEKDWKQLTYHLKLALYSRFPELLTKT